jgi:hypothetical protein
MLIGKRTWFSALPEDKKTMVVDMKHETIHCADCIAKIDYAVKTLSNKFDSIKDGTQVRG